MSSIDDISTVAPKLWQRSTKALSERRPIRNVIGIAESMNALARDDPRRVIHSLKVGLALTLVSLFYFLRRLHDSFGASALWAVMTVVVVFQFYVGATLGKGLNRTMATFVAGLLGAGTHYMAIQCGKTGEPIVIGLFVFLQSGTTTFMRFIPKIKANYDYGMSIFTLTFSLISISGFRIDEIIEMAQKRVSTIILGGFACIFISIFIYPAWAGEDLHSEVAANIEKLSQFLQGFGAMYHKASAGGSNENGKPYADIQGYKTVLNSKSTEENLATFAKWEPGHGRFRFHHPWNQYLIVGALVRECAYRIEALSPYLNPDSQIQVENQEDIEEACKEISNESSKALMELATALRTMTQPSSSAVNTHITNSKIAVKKLNSLLELGGSGDSSSAEYIKLIQAVPMSMVASLLIDVVGCTDKLYVAVRDLATLAEFKEVDHRDDRCCSLFLC